MSGEERIDHLCGKLRLEEAELKDRNDKLWEAKQDFRVQMRKVNKLRKLISKRQIEEGLCN
jgi:DNA-binding protein H-NS